MTLPANGNSLKFGTSGLRGLVTELCGAPAYDYARAFVLSQQESGFLNASADKVFVGQDLRQSSPAIADLCVRAIFDAGYQAVDCGALPTPALALSAMEAGAPAIMVTGSHIPDDRNGLKFYRPDGEIEKADEARIAGLYAGIEKDRAPLATYSAALIPGVDPISRYERRYLDFFSSDLLSGIKVGVYQHSSVARDILGTVLTKLGAEIVPLGRATAFIPVDTEAVREEDKALARTWAAAYGLDAIVSTDGDADRPLVADETGTFLRGDLLGAMTASYLGITSIVTPVTSNSKLEARAEFAKVIRTRVGSPFVIAALEAERIAGNESILGFEANGGVLLGSAVISGERTLPALATRDSLLPIIASLALTRRESGSLSQVAAQFRLAFAASDRIEHIPSDRSGALLARLRDREIDRSTFFEPVGGVLSFNSIDGVQFQLRNGETIHFRASGNAPEFRIYVEADNAGRAEHLLRWARGAAKQALGA